MVNDWHFLKFSCIRPSKTIHGICCGFLPFHHCGMVFPRALETDCRLLLPPTLPTPFLRPLFLSIFSPPFSIPPFPPLFSSHSPAVPLFSSTLPLSSSLQSASGHSHSLSYSPLPSPSPSPSPLPSPLHHTIRGASNQKTRKNLIKIYHHVKDNLERARARNNILLLSDGSCNIYNLLFLFNGIIIFPSFIFKMKTS